jgi:hypothetical protein
MDQLFVNLAKKQQSGGQFIVTKLKATKGNKKASKQSFDTVVSVDTKATSAGGGDDDSSTATTVTTTLHPSPKPVSRQCLLGIDSRV